MERIQDIIDPAVEAYDNSYSPSRELGLKQRKEREERTYIVAGIVGLLGLGSMIFDTFRFNQTSVWRYAAETSIILVAGESCKQCNSRISELKQDLLQLQSDRRCVNRNLQVVTIFAADLAKRNGWQQDQSNANDVVAQMAFEGQLGLIGSSYAATSIHSPRGIPRFVILLSTKHLQYDSDACPPGERFLRCAPKIVFSLEKAVSPSDRRWYPLSFFHSFLANSSSPRPAISASTSSRSRSHPLVAPL